MTSNKTNREILDALLSRNDEQVWLDYVYQNWKQKASLSHQVHLSESMIREYWEPLLHDWRFRIDNFSVEFYREFGDKIDWREMPINTVLDHKTIVEFADKLPLDIVLHDQNFTEEEIEMLMDKVILYGHNKEYNLATICKCQHVSDAFLEKYWEEIKYYSEYFCEHQKLSEAFIERHLDDMDWDAISAWQDLSEEFLDKYVDKINWYYIYEINSKILSEEYIKRIFAEKDYRKLTERFVRGYFKYFDWDWEELLKNIQFSKDFLKKYNKFLPDELVQKYQKDL